MTNHSPFRTILDRLGTTHLVVISPEIPDCDPSILPTHALCGAVSIGFTNTNPGDVACRHCLHLCPQFMGLAGFPEARR